MNLPQGHSGYAIDIEPEHGKIAVGTKGGLLFVIDQDWRKKLDEPFLYQKLVQGAPVLSVCWVKTSLLAVSDTAGRTLLWNTEQNGRAPDSLQVLTGNTCSLFNLNDGCLVGLTSKGILQFWDLSGGKLVQTININAPPPISALVRMEYWPDLHALACPNAGGELTLVNPEDGSIRTFLAHVGAFYAIAGHANNLLTVGMVDGRLKIWAPDSEKPVLNLGVQKNVISAGVNEMAQMKIVLVESNGKVSIYTLTEKRLRQFNTFPDQNYRVTVGPSFKNLQSIYMLQRSAEIKRLSVEIQEKAGRVSGDNLEELHTRLNNLGYKHISLALRCDQAEKDGKTVEAIRFCRELLEMLPDNDPNTCPSLEKYARLLEKAWHIHEADRTCQHIQRIDPCYVFSVQIDQIAGMAELLRDNCCIIEPDVSIDLIIESASVIGKKFYGCYVLNKLPPENCDCAKIDSKTILEKYELVRRESRQNALPPATRQTVHWLARTGTEQIDLLMFDNIPANGVKGLRFAVQILRGHLNTAIIPIVLFDWQLTETETSFDEENANAVKALNNIRNKSLSNPYLSTIHSALRLALRRLIAQNSRKQEYPLGR